MEAAERTSTEAPQRRADHLCVLVHGLWGNPGHLWYVAETLQKRHREDTLIILNAKGNSGSFTYDGIELGGERVTQEIEEKLESLAREGTEIKKISIVGYSLGGLVSRYAIGLLQSKGWFEKIKPINFTTFATPHLGVRTPLLGFHNHLWNVLGARTLSASGRQLFIIDSFRDTGRPLLSILADPNSVFMHGLEKFKNRSLYTNIVNDRSATYYTTGISRIDPYTNLSRVKINYLPGYAPIIVDPLNPVSPPDDAPLPTFYTRFATGSSNILQRIPLVLLLVVLIPIGTVIFLVNSGIQSLRSSRRIALHESGRAGIGIDGYRTPLVVDDVQSAVEGVFDRLNRRQSSEYLPNGTEEAAENPDENSSPLPSPKRARAGDTNNNASRPPTATSTTPPPLSEKPLSTTSSSCTTSTEDLKHPQAHPTTDPTTTPNTTRHLDFPTLALAPHQFSMIQALDAVGFDKYPVHIHGVRHSHAAIIVRSKASRYEEGKVVVAHWLDRAFEI